MSLKNILFLATICAIFTPSVSAQSSYEYNSDNASVYSRYGLGTLTSRSNGYNTSMGGAGLSLNITNRINTSNPASYSAIGGQTFLLDVGMSLDRNTISYQGAKNTLMGSQLTYINTGFQILKGLGVSLGYMPISSIGYDYMSSSHVGRNPNTDQEVRCANTYLGTGGLHQVYFGLGYTPFKNFSVGVNTGYVWGEYNHAMTQSFTEGGAISSGYSSQTTLYQANLSSYSLDFGVQYGLMITKRDVIGFGAVVGLGHNLGDEAHYYRYTANGDTTHTVVPKAFELPMTYALGLSYQRDNRLRVAVDAELQKWADCKLPTLVSENSDKLYKSVTGCYQNRVTYRLGAEYCPNALSRSYIKRVNYRVGAYYSTPYIKVNNQNGPKEYGVTAGFTLPITNSINGRSVVNIGFKWHHVEPSIAGMITENRLSLNLGVTFNEEWFKKWKIR